MPQNASLLYGNNILNLLKILVDQEGKTLNFDHEVTKAALITQLHKPA